MILIENVTKEYHTGQVLVKALDNISLQINKGEYIMISGASGSGKTTLLMMIAGMLKPTIGRVVFNGCDLYEKTVRERADFRSEYIGFVFQMFHLIPYLNVSENVALAIRGKDRMNDYGSLFESLGLQDRIRHKPAELSAGEKQRLALARAIINQPPVIMADEPTGNLDHENAMVVLKNIRRLHENGRTIIMATHHPEFINTGQRNLCLKNGKITEQPPIRSNINSRS